MFYEGFRDIIKHFVFQDELSPDKVNVKFFSKILYVMKDFGIQVCFGEVRHFSVVPISFELLKPTIFIKPTQKTLLSQGYSKIDR